MKRKLLALTMAFALALAACTPASSDTGQSINPDPIGQGTAPRPIGQNLKAAAEPDYPKAPGFEDYEAKWTVRERYPVGDDVWASISNFSARSAALALGGAEDNALYSPISLWFALTICAESAQGKTRTALLNALGLPQNTDVAAGANAVFNRLYQDNEMGALKLANSLWVNRSYSVKQEFLDKAAEDFYAYSYLCDFSDPATGKAMGDWLNEATGGLLGGQPLPTDAATLMALFSALYYSDQWIDEFWEENNTTANFYNADGTVSQAEYMNKVKGSHGWQTGDGWISSGLNLKNGGAMYFVLPDEGVTPGDLLSDPDTLAGIFAQENEGGWGEVVFQIPKFEVSDELDLKPVLEDMGAGIAFDFEKADFSNLSEEVLGLSSVKQEATLSIDEKGVTAAAYTEILYCGAAMPQGRAELILDRPFLFFVKVNGVPLFVGAVNQM